MPSIISFGLLSATIYNFPAPFALKDIFDVLIVSFFIYAFLILLKRTHAFFILSGIGILFLVYMASRFFGLALTSFLFKSFFTFFIVILVVIFQRELRRFFEWISAFGWLRSDGRETLSEAESANIIKAVSFLLKKHIGALIVIPDKQPIDRFLEGGITIDGHISSSLLISIFDPSSPGHDGAVVIDKNRLKKFSVHLPLAEHFDRNLGTRHRAAVGLSERTDALVIVVSEERGVVSLAKNGVLKELADIAQLKIELDSFINKKLISFEKRPWYAWITENSWEKLIAVLLAIFLWLLLIFR